ncbi:MAG: type IV pilus twitching motility protein PilT [Oscillospiraceae bacterium]|nr:type IV pilus twitching motility protein PilT [Oscillospiraceae bacterium]
MELKQLIEAAAAKKTSDVHLTVGLPPIFRVDGGLADQGTYRLTEEDVRGMALEIATEEQIKELDELGEVDFAVSFHGIRMRCNIFYQQTHTAMALRLLPLTVPSARDVGLPRVIVAQAEKPRGLILVTGPTGSGKSTTLAALLHHINSTRRRHIITLEAPIEYVHTPEKCIINQREVGNDTGSFASGLRAALRQDPDVILVGEMRDLETISTAITAAETGHLVFGTLHTKGAANTIDRIIDVFPPEQQSQIRIQLADVIECVVGQTLLPKIGGGRCAAYEIMVANPAIRSLIRQGKTFQLSSTMQTHKDAGMQLLDDGLIALIQQGLVTVDDAMTVANEPANLRFAKGAGSGIMF